jgi:hypothetical protein
MTLRGNVMTANIHFLKPRNNIIFWHGGGRSQQVKKLFGLTFFVCNFFAKQTHVVLP